MIKQRILRYTRGNLVNNSKILGGWEGGGNIEMTWDQNVQDNLFSNLNIPPPTPPPWKKISGQNFLGGKIFINLPD